MVDVLVLCEIQKFHLARGDRQTLPEGLVVLEIALIVQ
jgi:hypothetical protein